MSTILPFLYGLIFTFVIVALLNKYEDDKEEWVGCLLKLIIGFSLIAFLWAVMIYRIDD